MDKHTALNVLIACEFSGIVRDSFRAEGHNAYSCDLLPCEKGQEFHYQMDVTRVLMATECDWDMMVAHPPCTYLSNSGIRWLYNNGRKADGRNESRWVAMHDSCDFLVMLWNSDIERICIEQPKDHIHAEAIIQVPVTQSLQPYNFGDWETKEICLRLKNLPPLVPTYRTIDECREAIGLPAGSMPKPRVHRASPGPDRWKERSRTLPGIAKAMAQQWGQ